MNKKVKTITSWLAATVFLFALAINVKVTLDDPFVFINDLALASSTGSGSGWLWESQITTTPCNYTITTTVRVEDPNNPGTYIETTETATWTGVVKNCIDGWSLCSKDCVGAAPS